MSPFQAVEGQGPPRVRRRPRRAGSPGRTPTAAPGYRPDGPAAVSATPGAPMQFLESAVAVVVGGGGGPAGLASTDRVRIAPPPGPSVRRCRAGGRTDARSAQPVRHRGGGGLRAAGGGGGSIGRSAARDENNMIGILSSARYGSMDCSDSELSLPDIMFFAAYCAYYHTNSMRDDPWWRGRRALLCIEEFIPYVLASFTNNTTC
jgi:hypothetical protein